MADNLYQLKALYVLGHYQVSSCVYMVERDVGEKLWGMDRFAKNEPG